MKINQINYSDIGGGAEKISFLLHENYLDCGESSKLFVFNKYSNNKEIFSLDLPPAIRYIRKALQYHQGNFANFFKQAVDSIGNRLKYNQGLEEIQYAGFTEYFKTIDKDSDILHFHNLHGRYIDLNLLPEVSLKKPIVITLHDEWLYTGHCAATFGCERWLVGCGNCPHLDTYPPIKRDATRKNLQYKKDIVARSKIHVATPSRWLAERVQRSIIQPQELRVINNGIDLSVFNPGDKQQERRRLRIDSDSLVLLYVANKGAGNSFRDYTTVYKALGKVQFTDGSKKCLLLLIGGDERSISSLGNIQILNIPYIKEEVMLASYYRAADVLLYATHADNYPTIILEAMACGLAVIATQVGGISEQIEDQINGFLIPENDSGLMAQRIIELSINPGLVNKLGIAAAEFARNNFDVKFMAKRYLDWYAEILKDKNR